MYILGLNISPHDASAALLRDGALICLIEQERISRRKHAVFESPADAARACLAEAGITLDSVDTIAFGWNIADTPLSGSRRFTPDGVRRWLFPDRKVTSTMPALEWVPHHLAHAASCYYTCGEDDVAILVVDGAGETQATTLAHGSRGNIEILQEWPISQSLGFYYGLASQWAGLHLHFGPGKLMGLAGYGRPQAPIGLERRPDGYWITAADDSVSHHATGADRSKAIRLEIPAAFERSVTTAFARHYPFVPRHGEDALSYADFAATVQHELEEAAFGLALHARKRIASSTLALAGGVAMNCSMVGKLIQSRIYDRIYVTPVATDAGVSLGAALVAAARHRPFAPTHIDHPYWQSAITARSAAAAVAPTGLHCRALPEPDLARCAAAAIADGRIVMWARGRAEIGQRALGARSVLADPRDRRTWERLNTIKGREMWRPLAPSVLAEHIREIFESPVDDPARFMLAAASIRPAMRRVIPAVTHVDGSARPQLVDRATNPLYWSLIEHFRQLTGIPTVVNTSFNLAVEPIVHTAEDAVATFVQSGADLLVLDNLMIAKSESELDTVIAAEDAR